MSCLLKTRNVDVQFGIKTLECIHITRIRNTIMRMFGSKKNETVVQNIQYQQAEFIMNESLRGTQVEN